MPGEEDERPDGILTTGRSTDVSADRDGRADSDRIRVIDGARSSDAPKGRPSTPLMRTMITASAAPPQQFIGRDITITGTLTANGA
ncbi:MAG: hypothetical protein WAL97_09845, partial [Halobacteriota archaeon]